MRLAAVFAFVTAVGSLSKPSFLICVAPAAAFLMIYRLLRHLPVSVTGLFLGLYLPTVGILGWQLYATYSGHGPGGMYHDAIVWAPLKFMSYWATGLLWKFLLSICFPLAATALYWKSARADPMAQLAWLTFMIGAFYSYMLAERVHWDVGNLLGPATSRPLPYLWARLYSGCARSPPNLAGGGSAAVPRYAGRCSFFTRSPALGWIGCISRTTDADWISAPWNSFAAVSGAA